MNRGYIIKIVLALLLVLVLLFVGYKMVLAFTELITGVIGNIEVEDGYEEELVTPEPIPTMPVYIGEDSFYDNAGSVEFDDE